MARKSRWQQFSDNFNGVYGTFTKIGKDYESGEVMKKKYTDDQGNAVSGDALDRRRMTELADVFTKYVVARVFEHTMSETIMLVVPGRHELTPKLDIGPVRVSRDSGLAMVMLLTTSRKR